MVLAEIENAPPPFRLFCVVEYHVSSVIAPAKPLAMSVNLLFETLRLRVMLEPLKKKKPPLSIVFRLLITKASKSM